MHFIMAFSYMYRKHFNHTYSPPSLNSPTPANLFLLPNQLSFYLGFACVAQLVSLGLFTGMDTLPVVTTQFTDPQGGVGPHECLILT